VFHHCHHSVVEGVGWRGLSEASFALFWGEAAFACRYGVGRRISISNRRAFPCGAGRGHPVGPLLATSSGGGTGKPVR
jgi:hypothetical protein